MNACLTITLWLLALYFFTYYPTALFAGLAILLVWQYFVHETLIHPHMIVDGGVNAFPTRADFLANRLEQGYALIYDNCIICRDQPTSPVKTPCGHIFCRDCFFAWIDRGNARCPLCTRTLFREYQRTFEKAVKLAVAAATIGVPLGILNLSLGPGERLYIIYSTLTSTLFFVLWIHALCSRHEHRELWWKDVLNPDGGISDTAVEIVSFAVLLWALHQALVLEQWLPGPGERLWKLVFA